MPRGTGTGIVAAIRGATLLALATSAASAGSELPLAGRHSLGLQAGVWNQSSSNTHTEIHGGTVHVESSGRGGMGGLAYTHWFQEDLALRIAASGMAADVSSQVGGGTVSSTTATVVPILFGVKYYFPPSTRARKVRPNACASLGPFIGTQTESLVGPSVTAGTRTETAFGAQAGAGVDFVLSRRLLAGLAVGYNLMTDFERPIGGSDNFAGGILTLGLEVLL